MKKKILKYIWCSARLVFLRHCHITPFGFPTSFFFGFLEINNSGWMEFNKEAFKSSTRGNTKNCYCTIKYQQLFISERVGNVYLFIWILRAIYRGTPSCCLHNLDLRLIGVSLNVAGVYTIFIHKYMRMTCNHIYWNISI